MSILKIDQRTLNTPVINTENGEVLGASSVAVFKDKDLSLAYLVVNSRERANGGPAQYLISLSDIIAIDKYSISVRLPDDDRQKLKTPFSMDGYIRLIGQEVQQASTLSQVKVTEVTVDSDDGKILTITAEDGAQRKTYFGETLCHIGDACMINDADPEDAASDKAPEDNSKIARLEKLMANLSVQLAALTEENVDAAGDSAETIEEAPEDPMELGSIEAELAADTDSEEPEEFSDEEFLNADYEEQAPNALMFEDLPDEEDADPDLYGGLVFKDKIEDEIVMFGGSPEARADFDIPISEASEDLDDEYVITSRDEYLPISDDDGQMSDFILELPMGLGGIEYSDSNDRIHIDTSAVINITGGAEDDEYAESPEAKAGVDLHKTGASTGYVQRSEPVQKKAKRTANFWKICGLQILGGAVLTGVYILMNVFHIWGF